MKTSDDRSLDFKTMYNLSSDEAKVFLKERFPKQFKNFE